MNSPLPLTSDKDRDAKCELLRAAFNNLNRDLWESGDSERFPCVWGEIERIEAEFDRLTFEEVRRRLKFLYKQLAAAKGRRHSLWDSEISRVDAPRNHSVQQNTHPGHALANSHTNAPTIKENLAMSTIVEVRQDVLVKRGEYPATVVQIGQPEVSKFDPEKHSIKILFEISGGEFGGTKLSRWYTAGVSPKSALGILYKRILGSLPTERTVDLDVLLGKPCAIQVSHKDGEDGPYAVRRRYFKEGSEPSLRSV